MDPGPSTEGAMVRLGLARSNVTWTVTVPRYDLSRGTGLTTFCSISCEIVIMVEN